MVNPLCSTMLLGTWIKFKAFKQRFIITLSSWIYSSSSRQSSGTGILLESAFLEVFSLSKASDSAFLIKDLQKCIFSRFFFLFFTSMWHFQQYYILSISAFLYFWQHVERKLYLYLWQFKSWILLFAFIYWI